MLKNIIKTIGFTNTPVLTEAERLSAQEEKMLAISLKAYQAQPERPQDIPLIEVQEITDPAVIQETMERFAVLPNKNANGAVITENEYNRAKMDKARDPWKGVSKRAIR